MTSNVIFSYTRAQAIVDRVLIDATDAARRAGYLVPVALTSGAWSECVLAPPNADPENEANEANDESRLLAVLWALRRIIEKTGGWKSHLGFTVHLRKRVGDDLTAYRLKAVLGPDDDARPCVTIMLPQED